MDGYGPASYGDAMADVYDEWFASTSRAVSGGARDVGAVGAVVQRLSELAAGGPALELGVGSGRLAVPLAARGTDVWGIDASDAMVARLRAKPGGERVRVTVGDMAELMLVPAAGGTVPRFSVVFAAYNTLFNLTTRDEQVRCLRRVATLLDPHGALVVEAFVPRELGEPGGRVTVRTIEVDRVVLSASRHDPIEQTVVGQYVEIDQRGTRLRPWCVRYATPGQLDEMAAEAGFGLRQRHGGWQGERFDDTSPAHVSVYGLAASGGR